jgi:hypothetical protein
MSRAALALLDLPALEGESRATAAREYYDFGVPVDISLPPADQVERSDPRGAPR